MKTKFLEVNLNAKIVLSNWIEIRRDSPNLQFPTSPDCLLSPSPQPISIFFIPSSLVSLPSTEHLILSPFHCLLCPSRLSPSHYLHSIPLYLPLIWLITMFVSLNIIWWYALINSFGYFNLNRISLNVHDHWILNRNWELCSLTMKDYVFYLILKLIQNVSCNFSWFKRFSCNFRSELFPRKFLYANNVCYIHRIEVYHSGRWWNLIVPCDRPPSIFPKVLSTFTHTNWKFTRERGSHDHDTILAKSPMNLKFVKKQVTAAHIQHNASGTTPTVQCQNHSTTFVQRLHSSAMPIYLYPFDFGNKLKSQLNITRDTGLIIQKTYKGKLWEIISFIDTSI